MADKYQEAILNAISYIVDNKVASIDRDKTITATIVCVNDASTQEYRVSYNGGTIIAYAQENASYAKDASVYVLVPEGNFSKRKTIIGLATSTASDKNSSFTSSLLNNYNKLGGNCFKQPEDITRWGLNSYKKEDYKLIYQHGVSDPNFVQVDNVALAAYLKEATALMLQGTFQTALPKEHRYSSSGTYGVSFTLAFKNGDAQVKQYSPSYIAKVAVTDTDYSMDESSFAISVSNSAHRDFVVKFLAAKRELLDNWAKLQDNDISTKAFTTWYQTFIKNLKTSASSIGLSIDSYLSAINAYDTKGNIVIPQEDYEITSASAKSAATILANSITWVENNPGAFAANTFIDYFKKLRYTDDTKRLYADKTYSENDAFSSLLDDFLSILENAKNGQEASATIASTETPAVKHVSYVLDSTNMLGNPVNYATPVSQYNIFSINPENFLYVESILLFSKDFVEKDDYATNYHDDNNIFFSDFQIFGLQTISSVSGDYILRINMPQGGMFTNTLESNTLTIEGEFTRLQDDLSDSASFLWFRKDDRISSSSEDYRVLAGAGWRYMSDSGTTKNLVLKASDNRAYENKYLCVIQYQTAIVLKAEFTIYNTACQRDIAVESNFPDNTFSFDRGNPVLTCKINGKGANFETGQESPHVDSLFSFSWSVTDADGNVRALNKTVAEIEQEIAKAKKDNLGYSKILSLQAELAAMEGVVMDGNILTYPVSQISESATFSCSVFLKDNASAESYYIGAGELTLRNASAASTDYSIRITNGDQVFQYSESGVAPTSERLADPQEVAPLECRFFDPNGIEVNSNTYTVRWRVPLSDTMITTPSEGMVVNSANSLKEWYSATPFPLGIAETYDYQATHNQVTCIVSYQGKEYSQDSILMFTKIGDNGTNGTDVVAKISAPTIANDGLFALTLTDKSSGTTVSTNAGDNAQLSFNLYRQSVPLNPTAVTWSVAPMSSRAKNLQVKGSGSKCTLTWGSTKSSTSSTKYFEDLVVKAVTTMKSSVTSSTSESADDAGASSTAQTYNAFYPVPVIHYGQNCPIYIKIQRDETLKQVLYNADGRNPLYNKKQGVLLKLYKNSSYSTPIDTEYRVKWSVRGGKDGASSTASLRLSATENSAYSKGSVALTTNNAIYAEVDTPVKDSSGNIIKNDDGTTKTITSSQFSSFGESVQVYVVPADVYSGEYINDVVEGTVYQVTNSKETQVAVVTVPIFLSLNSYGLASLNAWDGNHIEINEDGNYILAPQIGAGYKGEDPNDATKDNVFTGIVMGQATTYDSDTSTTGLLGYSGGKQSIFLDATSGKAVFGLPRDQASAANAYREGRVEIVPGGESKIGMWSIGSKAMYNGLYKEMGADKTWMGAQSKMPKPYTNDNYRVADAEIAFRHFSENGKEYDMRGIVLGADPSYISVKGKPLGENSSSTSADGVFWDDANTVIKRGDSLEVEIDPNKASVFSIYRHTNWEQGKQGEWHRYPLVGINANGQFYTNAVENGNSSMGIGLIGAFGSSAADGAYVGGQFAYSSKNIFKFFTDANATETTPLYLSSGTTLKNEYARPVKLYGKNVEVYANNGASTDKTSNHYLKINDSDVTLGHTVGDVSNYIKLTTNISTNNVVKLDTSNTQVNLAKNFISTIGGTAANTVTGAVTNTFRSTLVTSIGSNETHTVIGTRTLTVNKDNSKVTFSLGQTATPLLLEKSNTATNTASSRLKVNSAGDMSIVSQQGMTLLNNNAGQPTTIVAKGPGAYVQIGAIQQAENTTNETINLASGTPAYLRLKARSDGQSWFSLESNRGSVYSNPSSQSEGGDTKGLSISIPYVISTNSQPGLASNVNPNMIVVDPLLYTPGAAIFAGKYSAGVTGALYNCSVFAQQGVLSNRFMLWDNNSVWKTWQSKVTNTDYRHENLTDQRANNVEEILKWLLEEIEKVRGELIKYTDDKSDNAYKQALKDAKDHIEKYAYSKDDTYTKSEINTSLSGKANASHTHSQYVENSTYNNHKHTFNTVALWVGDGLLSAHKDQNGDSFNVPNAWKLLSAVATSTPSE